MTPHFKIVQCPPGGPVPVGRILSLEKCAELFEINAADHLERLLDFGGASRYTMSGYVMDILWDID